MMAWLRLLQDLVDALQSGRDPAGLSGAAALGLFMGLVPGWPLQVWLAGLVLLIFDFELTLAGLALLAGAALGWLLDPALDAAGAWLLAHPALQDLWTGLYGQSVWRLTRFNNSVVLASTLLGLLLLVPLDLLLKALLRRYLAVWRQRLALLRWLRPLDALRRWIQKLQGAGA